MTKPLFGILPKGGFYFVSPFWGYVVAMLLLLLACKPNPDTAQLGANVSERLTPGQVRAGRVESADALFGGVSAEGAVGDWKIYNANVQFIVQDIGDSSYYIEYGGGLIDADVVRPAGEPGRDMLDEMGAMVGFARVMDAQTVEVCGDGSGDTDAPIACLRVAGPGAPMRLATGALESPEIVPDLDLWIQTDFELAPDAWSMKMTTTVTSHEAADQSLAIGEIAMVSLDVAEPWRPGVGLDAAGDGPVEWVSAIGQRNEGALAILAEPDATLEQGTIGKLLGALGQVIAGFGPTATLPAEGSMTWTRWVGVASDPATLSGERLGRGGADVDVLSGTTTPGARVHVLDAADGPVTVAFADAAGGWSATVPRGDHRTVETGRGTGIVYDLPEGHGWPAPYEGEPASTLATLTSGSVSAPFAEGWGVAPLVAPGTVHVQVADGGPAVARLCFASADPVAADVRLTDGRPEGCAAIGFVRDGDLDIPAEPGDYVLVVHRGVRDELYVQDLTVVSGQTVNVVADVHAAYTIAGVLTGDPHTHASPSGDAAITMEQRLLSMAAHGVDVHFGTDHDHIADYRPLLAPLGLSDRLQSVVCDEVSPVLRGHFNMYPAVATMGANHGAPRWWLGYTDTAEIFGWMRDNVGESGIIQANHPVGDSGMFSFAGLDPVAGTIADAERWSDDFNAMEVNNSGEIADYLPYYLALVNRGRVVTPVGVSDSHSATGGGVGLNQTYLLTGTPLADFDADVLVDTLHRRATVVSRGPYIDARVGGAFAAGSTVTAGSTLQVEVYAPSWMPVETVSLLQDGVVIDTLPCDGAAPMPCAASWTLDPMRDASYAVIAESTTAPMQWAHAGSLAWAMTSATFVDVAGDGWEAPLPALVFR